MTNRLSWYWARARTMTVPEVAWRAGRVASDAVPRGRREVPDTAAGPEVEAAFARFRAAAGRPVVLDRSRAAEISRRFPAEAAAVIAAADATLQGRFAFFGQDPVDFVPDGIDWNLDPRTGYRWPLRPAAKLDHRTMPGDPKWIWELNRLQHLPWLAQAWLFTGDRRYADGAFAQLDSWLEQNPIGRGIAWRGAFEVGVRAMSLAIGAQGLRDAPGFTVERYRRLVTMLSDSAPLLWRQRSRFSSANNHLVGEMAGLAVTAILFPEIAGARLWEDRAVKVLTAEAGRQILPDGAGAEQSTVYQLFCSDLFVVPAALIRLRGDVPPPALVDPLRRGARYLRTLVGDGEPLPRYGDDDGGLALRLHSDPLPDVHRHLALVAATVDAPAEAPSDLASAWLAGSGAPAGRPSPPAVPRDLFAPNGGLVVLRRENRRLLMDVGPLGYLAIAAHGHADALSVTVTADGQDLIGDPGTGSYYAEPAWRRAFRGTPAHATVSVDDLDQSVSGGAFLWTRHAVTTVRAVDVARGIVDAEHDGYRRLAAPVTHRRVLVAPPGWDSALVVDLLRGEGTHRLRTAWPLHPALEARQDGGVHHVTRDGAPVLQVATAATAPTDPYAVRGDESTRLGWWSPRFESRTPAWLVGSVAESVELPVVVATVLSVSDSAAPVVEGLAVVQQGDRVEVTWTERGAAGTEHRSVRLDRRTPGAVVRHAVRM